MPSSFEKLAGRSNYLDWSYAMQVHLINCDLWDVVTVAPPEAENAIERTAWEECNRRALAAIVSGIEKHIFVEVRDLKSGQDVWN